LREIFFNLEELGLRPDTERREEEGRRKTWGILNK